jgi:effector-binding domain-containing protein
MDSAPEMITVSGGPAIAIRVQLSVSELPAFFGGAFHELVRCAGASAAGAPFARYHHVDEAGVDVEAVLPVSGPIAVTGRVCAIELGTGPAVQVQHVGPYDELPATYASIDRWLDEHHRRRSDAVREVYLTNPAEVPDPSRWQTLVIQPIA